MSDTKLVIAFDARIGNLERQLEQVNRSLSRTDRQAKQTASSFALLGTAARAAGGLLVAAFATVAGGLGVGALAAGISAAVGNINALADAAQQVGLQASQLQSVQIAFEEAGSSSQAATTAMGRLATMTGEAAEGGKEAQQTFVRLGISFRNLDGSARTTEQVFNDVAAKIRETEDEQQKLAIAAAFFGRRAAPAVVAAMNEMGGSIDEAVGKYQRLGIIVSKDTADAIDALGVSFANLARVVVAGIADAIAYVQPAMSLLIDAVSTTLNFIFTNIIRPVVLAIETVVAALTPSFTAIANAIVQLFSYIGTALAPVFDWIGRRLTELLSFAQDVLRFLGILERTAADQATRDISSAERQIAANARLLAQANEALRNAQAPGTSETVRVNAERRVTELMQRQAELADRIGTATTVRTRALQQQALPALPTPPALVQPPGAPPVLDPQNRPRAQTSEAERELARNLREAERTLERIRDKSASPLEALRTDFDRTVTSIQTLQQNFQRLDADQRAVLEGLTFSTFATQAEEAAKRTAEAMVRVGASTAEIERQIEEAVRAFGQRLVDTGRLTAEQMEQMVERARTATQRVTQRNQTFSEGLRAGAGMREGEVQPSLDFSIAQGLVKNSMEFFDDLVNTLNKIAEGSVKAGDALVKLGLDFARAVAMMIAKAAALRLVQSLMTSILGPAPVAAGVPSGGNLMTGGATAGGFTYLVGERGPELFTSPGSGRVISNADAFGGGGPALVINNNAPGVVVTRQQVDDRTVIAAVNMARTEVARDYGTSMRTGFGPFAEHLTRTHQVRRRL